MDTLKLKDLYIGCIDAKNGFLESDSSEAADFIDTYLVPENIDTDEYLDGKLYFVTGLKGTGKTAFLRYLASLVEQKGRNSSFVLFKSDICEEDRIKFHSEASIDFVDKIDGSVYLSEYEHLWSLFLHRFLVRQINEKQVRCYENNNDLKRYVKCVSAPKTGDKESGLWRLFPIMKKGAVEIGGDFGVYGKLQLDFEWSDKEKKKVRINALVQQADELLKKLTPTESWLYVFIDELELSVNHKAQYNRDAKLIRDLIVVVNQLNEIFIRNKHKVRIVVGIRSEVVNVAATLGKEINKPLSDFGESLYWHQSGGDINNHPLLQMIYKRISLSEDKKKIGNHSSATMVWEKYFPNKIQGLETPNYILHNSWYRPRDIVRMLLLCQKHNKNRHSFSHDVFDSIRKLYSTDSWNELSEELIVKYSPTDIQAIRRIFYGIRPWFTCEQLQTIVARKKHVYKTIMNFVEKCEISTMLEDLYRVGVVGNTGENVRFVFRGDDEILLEKRIMIHPALWNYFSVERS